MDAPVLGPLLKIEQRLSREARDIFGTGVIQRTLAESVEGSSADSVEAEIVGALASIADSATSTSAQRLFAAVLSALLVEDASWFRRHDG